MLHLGDFIELPQKAIRGARGGDGATWATHEVIQGKPRGQLIGPKSSVFTLDLYFHVSFISPKPTVTFLKEMAHRGDIFQVWSSAGSYWGTWYVADVDWTPKSTLPDGRVISLTCTLTFGDPGQEVTVLERPLAVRETAVPVAAFDDDEEDAEDLSTPIEDVTNEEIARI